MSKYAPFKWLLLVALIAGSLAVVYPPSQRINLGLDLQGGTSFLVEIDKTELAKQISQDHPDMSPEQLQAAVNKGARDARENALEVIRNRVDGLGISEPNIYHASHKDQERIVVQLPGISEERRAAARDSIESVAFLTFRLVHKQSHEWVDALLRDGKAPRGYKLGSGGDYYVRDLSVPDEEMGPDFWEALRRWEYHTGCDFMLERDTDENGSTQYKPYYVEQRPQLTGEYVKTALVEYHPVSGQPYISLEFDGKGARRFAAVTRNNAPRGPKNPDSDVGRQLAIVLDGSLYSAPVINEEIPSGRAQITGRFSAPEAMRLANVLRAGSLPVPVNIVETRTVDPSLGQDSIDSGTRAVLLGGIAVLLFMMLYYRLAGVVANLALLLDLILLPLGALLASGFLSLISGDAGQASGVVSLPTLTLPGIAGIVLTIGMAVDANVLIFERIREEQKAGKRFTSAVAAGYEKAFSTIFDANITTLLTAAILFWQGSGPIRGFAITLSAGIIVSMYTALVITRMLFNIQASRGREKPLSMMRLIGETKVNFVGKRMIAAIVSLTLIALTWSVFYVRGSANFGIDFTGGSSVVFRFDGDHKVDSDDLRSALSAAGVDGAVIQYQQEMVAGPDGKRVEYLEVRSGQEQGEQVQAALEEGFPEAAFVVVKEDSVGGQVGKELQKKGILAIVWALVGIVVYITIRFEFAFATGAIAALVHDVLLTVGLYCLLGYQLSLPVVAALLTIVGYSVNDTIVVFDRIREDLKLLKGRSYGEIANLSINQTLSRTLLTSITTLLSVTMLLIFGGGSIRDFALTLCIGILVGTYSSIFVATPIMLIWHRDDKAKGV